jgi:FAD/FMN-containing dehydrogenase
MELSGWGRYPRATNLVVVPEAVAETVPPRSGRMIARGQGRSYGDAAMLEDGLVLLTKRVNHLISFDETSGILKAEAGATIAQIVDAFVPRGWFPTVVPGTKFVSLGGCVAADIHGKNHHCRGAFGAHVREIEIVLSDRSRQRCSPEHNAELFRATVGGMGLTGIITEVAFELRRVESPFMIAQHIRARDLDESLEMLDTPKWDDHYTVVWVDSLARGRNLGRSVFIRGHHAAPSELPNRLRTAKTIKHRQVLDLQFDFPSRALNSFTVGAFNGLYYRWQGSRDKPFVADYDTFFFPLDRIGNWNRMYGARGFVQYQFVIPPVGARKALRIVLEELARKHRSSFLTVLKRFGPEGCGTLSFPMAGYTLALDLPVSDAGLFPFLHRLDEIVLGCGGRVYLAKDARLRAETFRAMYPRFAQWREIKARIDPENRFASDLSRRLEMTPP